MCILIIIETKNPENQPKKKCQSKARKTRYNAPKDSSSENSANFAFQGAIT